MQARIPTIAKAEDGGAAAALEIIDARRLFYFFHVARLGSFSMAETFLDIAQSAISRQLQQLERELDVQLLERKGRGVELTPIGKAVFERARVILAEMTDTRAQVKMLARRPPWHVSIAAPSSFTNLYMHEILRRFEGDHADIQLRVLEGPTGQVYEWLVSGQVDLAVITKVPNTQRLSLQKIANDPLIVAMSKDHPLAGKTSLAPRKLSGLRVVLPATPHGLREVIEKYFTDAGVVLTPSLEIDGMTLTKRLVAESDMVTVMPLLGCIEEVQQGKLAAVPLAPQLTRQLQLAQLSAQPPSPAARKLAQALLGVVREMNVKLPLACAA